MTVLLLSVAGGNAQQPDDSLVAYWPFDGSVNDASGNGHHGTAYGWRLETVVYTADRFGSPQRAIVFDGVNDRVVVQDHEDFRFDTGESFSISLWMKSCPESGLGMVLIAKYPVIGTQMPLGFYISGTPGNAAHASAASPNFNGLGNNVHVRSRNSLSDGKWHHIVLVVSDTIKTPFSDSRQWVGLYIDGQLEDVLELHDSRATVGYENNAGNVTIGHTHTSAPLQFYEGAIDELRVYNRVLSFAEIRQLYSEGGWPIDRGDLRLIAALQPLGDTVICRGEALLLQRTGTADRYVWNTTEGLTDTLSSVITAAPDRTTTYRLTGYREFGGAPCIETLSHTVEVTVVVREVPEADAGPDRQICLGDTIRLGGVTGGGEGPYRWRWSPTYGLSDSTAEHPVATPTRSERYQVIVTDAKGCRDTASAVVTVFSRPEVEIGDRDTLYYCMGSGGVELVAVMSREGLPYIYTWSGGHLNRYDSSHVLAAPAEPTVYYVEVGYGIGDCTGTDSVLVIPVESPRAEAGADRTICRGESVKLGDGSSGKPAWIYEWSPQTGLNDRNLAEPTATPLEPTLYLLHVTDPATGCRVVDSVVIDVIDIDVEPGADRLDFGLVDGCRSDTVLVLELQNAGRSDGEIVDWGSNVPGIGLIDANVVVPGGGTAGIRVRFSPADEGSYSGTLVLYTGPCRDSIVVEIVGVKETSTIGIEPGSVDFGLTLSCDMKSRDTLLVVRNGTASDGVIEPTLVGSPYLVVTPALPLTIPAGEERNITLRYAPTGAGNFAEELRLPYISGTCRDTLRVILQGEVEDAVLGSEVTEVDFGLLSGCTSERDSLVELKNGGSVDLQINEVELPDGFSLTENLPITIPAGGSKRVSLRFASSKTGPMGGRAIFRYLPCQGELALELRGEKRGIRFTVTDTLDFGELVFCGEEQGKILPLHILLESGGAGDGEVELISLSEGFSGEVPKGSVLRDGREERFAVSFIPTRSGRYAGELVVRLQPCGAERRVVVLGKAMMIEVRGEGVDFGQVPVGSDRTDQVLFINRSDTSVRIEYVNLPPGLFTVLNTSPALPADLDTGDTLYASVLYRPGNGISRADVEATLSSPCERIYRAEVGGEGKGAGYARVRLPQLTATPGERVRLNVEVPESSGLPEAGITGFVAEVAFEESLMVVAGDDPWRIDGTSRIVEVRGDLKSGTAEMTVTLGRVEMTDLRLRAIRWLDGQGNEMAVDVDTIHGLFKLRGLCREGGVRLYDPRGEVGIKSVSPNPGNGKFQVKYGLAESGGHRLVLIDGLGRQVADIFDGLFVPGEYLMEWKADGLAGGIYYLVLQTPSLTVSHQIMINR